MRIGTNIRYLQKHFTGIERATLELICAISRLTNQHQLIGYVTGPGFVSADAERDLEGCTHLELKQVPPLRNDVLFRLLWDLMAVGQQASRDQVDLFWGTSFSLPFRLKAPGVVTIYDTSFIHYPEAFDRVSRLWHRLITPSSAHRACAVLTISESSKQDIVRFLRVPPERVHIIPLAAGSQFRPQPEQQAEQATTLRHYGIRAPFLLSVSQISPRKNLVRLVNVYAAMCKEHNFQHQLVLVGKNGWLYQEVYDAVQQAGLASNVIFTGGVSDAELVHLYNTAALFVYPSLYEGFGLPVLEAMACGLPVITANTSSLPEVVGDAGILVAPTDERALAGAINQVWQSDELRRDLRGRGLARATAFSWEQSGQRVLTVFEQINAMRP